MYRKAYGVIETLAPVHVGATAGEETGNLNLIFRDQFTQTGIIPGSSIRGRFRADLRDREPGEEQLWYGHEAVDGRSDGGTTEALVKFEYASLVWFPVFCPGQPVVWVSCPLLLKRFKRIAGVTADIPEPYTAQKGLQGRPMKDRGKILFFNLGFLEIEHEEDLSAWIPAGTTDLDANKLVVVHDNDIAMLHDMALYRQSRVKLGSKEKPNEKKVDGGAFFNTEALPEGSILVFPIALKQTDWKPFGENENSSELYFGGLESIGFGRCLVSLSGDYQ
ncbi:RAMP superfamily CRISPR-associated protein [Microcoleus sp. Pol17_C1]|jgi:CRISPR-associated protein Cmr4|uniref:RAMP superfamily CRISPR-associated protein n=1 Tax=unclassified Microcoleus TaxID=2642155 RepID=UPI002FD53DDE